MVLVAVAMAISYTRLLRLEPVRSYELLTGLVFNPMIKYMGKSTINPSKKNKRGRPPIDSDQINARFERPTLNAIDDFISQNSDIKNRPEAVRRLVELGLKK